MLASTRRFRVIECLGKGGMGVVYRVRDEEMQRDVALKTLRRVDSDDLYHLKEEFRALAGILHPNLVELHELFVDGASAFFTMEVVDGVGLLDHLWSDDGATGGTGLSRAGVARLDAALPQLVAGIAAVHAAGRLHRDIKPSNVMVSHDGRVVLLDFGLAARWDVTDSTGSASAPVGTGVYMSPEQAQGLALTPASDWYALGVVLYEALTGALPFTGTRDEVLALQRAARFASPVEMHPELPRRYDELVRALLNPDPARRPDAREVLRRLRDAPAADSSPPEDPSAEPPFVGRAEELSALDAAFSASREGAFTLVCVEGVSGSGKTELVRRFVTGVERAPPSLVLRGRCLPQESVAYRAFDGVVDALSRRLVREPSAIEALAEPDRQALLRVFPVLSRALPATAVPPRPDEVDPRALRQVGFEALRAVLASVARAAPLVVWIDDAQWADADSAALAKELFARDDAPPLLLVVSYQSERRDDSALLKALDALPGRRELRVGQLPPREAEALAARALGADTDDARRLAALVARESGGSPFFVLQLAQDLQESGGATAPRLGDVVRRRIDALDPDAQRLLTLAAVAGAAVERRTLLRAASMGEWGRREVTRLVSAGLLRLSPVDGQPAVETRHDRVREAILAAGGEAVRRDAHRRLADALLDQKSDDLDALVLHLVGAGDDDRAARYALPAAERASEALAFDHAASLYRVALRAPHRSVTRDEVLTRLAEALTSAGRGGEAAQAYMEAAAALAQTRPSDPMVMDLRRRAAERFVCSGRYVEGMRVMREVLDAAGVSLPSTPRGAALAGVGGRVRFLARGLKMPEAQRSPDARALRRLDAMWTGVVSYSMVQPAFADALGVQHLAATLEIGDPSRAVRALGYEATSEASVGGAFFRGRARRILDVVDGVASRTGSAYDRAWARMARGTTAWFESRWRSAHDECVAAADLWRSACRGVAWEVATSEIYALSSLALMGRLNELSSRLTRALREAEDREDLFAAGGYVLGEQAVRWLALDRADEWRALAERVKATWPPGAWNLQRYQHLVAATQAELYDGDGARAYRTVDAEWEGLGSAQLLRLECARVELHQLRGRAALAAVGSRASGLDAPSLHARALADAKVIDESTLAWAAPLAALLRAGVALQQGRSEAGLASLRRATTGFDAAEMSLFAAVTRARVGRIEGGAAGRAAVASAEAFMAAQGVVNPERLSRCVLPA